MSTRGSRLMMLFGSVFIAAWGVLHFFIPSLGKKDREETGERSRGMTNKKKWSELTTAQKRGIVLSGIVQIALLAAALLDIYRRPKEKIRGNNKWLWTLASFVNFVGPISYFLFGRRR